MKRTAVRAWRKRNGLTQMQAAKILGVSQSVIAAIETGRHRVTDARAISFDNLTDGDLPKWKTRPDLWAPE